MIPKSYRVADKLAKPVQPAADAVLTIPEFKEDLPEGIKPDPWEVPTIIATIVVCGGATLGLALAKYMGWVS